MPYSIVTATVSDSEYLLKMVELPVINSFNAYSKYKLVVNESIDSKDPKKLFAKVTSSFERDFIAINPKSINFLKLPIMPEIDLNSVIKGPFMGNYIMASYYP